MMNKSEWKKVKLEECADINMGQSPISSSYNIDGNGIPFYQGNADFGELYPKLRYYCSKPIKVANEEDLLLSVRAPIGKINIAKTSCCIGRGLCAITPKKDIVLQKYLYYILKYKENEFNLKGTGSTFKAINKKQISETMFLLPDINIQKNIILKLENSEKLLKLKKEQLSELEKLVKFQFLKIFGDPILNEKNWEIVTCQKISFKIGSGSTPLGGEKNYKSEGISFIRSLNIYNNKFITDGLVFIEEIQAEKLKNVNVEKDDILLNITGASVARTCIVPVDVLPARVNQHVSIIRCNKEIIEPVFLCYQLTNAQYQLFLLKIAKNNGATREALTKEQLENLKIILPPIELQNKFAEFVKQVDKSKVEKFFDFEKAVA